MYKFIHFIVGLALGYLTAAFLLYLLSIPERLEIYPGGLSFLSYMILWAIAVGPMFGLALMASKEGFGKKTFALFLFFTLADMALGAFLSVLILLEHNYFSLDTVVGLSIPSLSGVLFLFWYLCIRSGDCFFKKIYFVPLGLIALTIGVFALVCLISITVAFFLTFLVAIGCLVTAVIIKNQNGSIVDDYGGY